MRPAKGIEATCIDRECITTPANILMERIAQLMKNDHPSANDMEQTISGADIPSAPCETTKRFMPDSDCELLRKRKLIEREPERQWALMKAKQTELLRLQMKFHLYLKGMEEAHSPKGVELLADPPKEMPLYIQGRCQAMRYVLSEINTNLQFVQSEMGILASINS